MEEFPFDELVLWFKHALLWIITTVIFTSQELQEEASRHVNSGVIRIPGVCYGLNFIKGFQAIGLVFPGRSGRVRLDYIFGYFKLLLLTACVCGLIVLLAKYSAGL